MPKKRPQQFLLRLGRRLKARRVQLERTQAVIARQVEISVNQLAMYESGTGHPPAATLARLAVALGTTSSALLGETDMADHTAGHYEELMDLSTDTWIGSVMRAMQAMSVEERRLLHRIAGVIPVKTAQIERAEVMK